MDIHDKPTEQSIQRAKAARDAERAGVFDRTGLRITDAVRPEPARDPEFHKMACRSCHYTASGVIDGQVVNSLAAHIVHVHFPQHVKEGR